MKEFEKFFKRPYSSVHNTDDDAVAMMKHHQATGQLATIQRATLDADKQRRKSLKANQCSMNPAGILSSFFNERRSNTGGRSPKCAFVLLAVGILAITTAVLVKIFHPYDLIFKWKLVLTDNGEIFNLWEKPPVDLYIKIYLFNITNADAFLAGRERMNVEQVGPYVYKELMTHQNITFNANNTISTTPSHPLVWQEHLSEGRREDDQVVMLNIAMLSISHLMADKGYFARVALNTLFMTSKTMPIVRMTAKEFMFGFPSSLTTLGNTFLPNWIHFEKVGLIDRMYDFDTDFETFYTGVPDPSLSGLYATYRGDANLPHWDGEHCSNIAEASDGTKFKSFIQPNESIKFFRKSMCRPINLYRDGEAQTYGSLSGYKYIFEENALDNGEFNENNTCFCRKGVCQPRGLIDVTDCYYGFPISLSYPHFMEGHPGLQENITGLAPSKENHSSAFVVQPESGLPLSISVKIQINMHFNDLRAITKASRFSHLTAPMLWFEIMMPQLPDSLESRFNFYLNYLPYLDFIGFWGGLLLGIALLGYAVTRATIRMSTFTQTGNISEGTLYSKANLWRTAGAGGSVYNPCEMKLITSNEKPPASAHVITRSDVVETDDVFYTEIDMKKRHSFALELEPAISDSNDEGNESDTATLSRNSTTSSCMNEKCDNCTGARRSSDGNERTKCSHSSADAKETSISYGSSGLASSVSDSRDIALCIDSECANSPVNGNSSRWSMGETASLVGEANNNSPTAVPPTKTRNSRVFEV